MRATTSSVTRTGHVSSGPFFSKTKPPLPPLPSTLSRHARWKTPTKDDQPTTLSWRSVPLQASSEGNHTAKKDVMLATPLGDNQDHHDREIDAEGGTLPSSDLAVDGPEGTSVMDPVSPDDKALPPPPPPRVVGRVPNQVAILKSIQSDMVSITTNLDLLLLATPRGASSSDAAVVDALRNHVARLEDELTRVREAAAHDVGELQTKLDVARTNEASQRSRINALEEDKAELEDLLSHASRDLAREEDRVIKLKQTVDMLSRAQPAAKLPPPCATTTSSATIDSSRIVYG
ncbi:Aste57867_853 [Aphanomyces stellatus]|uniref:Aste57867_853 protein n=1 Tax=Aphanomyces stellatus TaxID=120398 RepID=A0A485K7T3_9STRA|nr:hypothetical protein As57867_000852 [Aphanomyces stellatus]VFT78077.1 Aste57867_853 [Aphanomyces stellatus]